MEEFFLEFTNDIIDRVIEAGILDTLYQRKVIGLKEKRRIGNLSNEENKRKLIEVLEAKDPHVLHDFVDAIEECSTGKELMTRKFRNFLQKPTIPMPTNVPANEGGTASPTNPTKKGAFCAAELNEKYSEWYTVNSKEICSRTINLSDLVLNLSTQFLVAETMEAELEDKKGDPSKCAHLYRSLVKRGFDRIDEVIECLKKSQNSHIAKLFIDFKESQQN